MENKHDIVEKLQTTLQATRYFNDLISLEYDDENETVTAVFVDGYTKRANVAADSGISIINDVIRQIM